MKICYYCQTENSDNSTFCKNCGRSFKKHSNSQSNYREDIFEENTYEMNNKHSNIFEKYFYIVDKEGKYRISKTRLISAVWFILIFLYSLSLDNPFDFTNIILSVIVGLIFALPVYVAGWIIGKLI